MSLHATHKKDAKQSKKLQKHAVQECQANEQSQASKHHVGIVPGTIAESLAARATPRHRHGPR